ncbi:hypothetical protein LKO27_00400 [Tessaracoccus sp. OS52]|uniref:hypothetical protein n=1 Tax=Tessaracoccus sp. OS52 TaxID=2886691 RepID=UPI001D124710|nr:hypothetical protein [Tessaracoccus sp. OS52]MCC2591891.1 hypothetical protein [Tessaracoccus sp. OS52]
MSQQLLGHVDVPASGPAYWRAVWSRRHTVTAVAAAVALFAVLMSARGAVAALDVALLGLAAVVGAITLATYVPPAGVPLREHATGGSCGIIPVLAVVGAPVLLSQAAPTLLPLIVLLACYGLAMGKRITDHASC